LLLLHSQLTAKFPGLTNREKHPQIYTALSEAKLDRCNTKTWKTT